MEKQKYDATESGASRLSRIIISIVTCLGALGFLALLYFPLQHLK